MAKKKDCKVLFNTLIQRMWKAKDGDEEINNPLYCIDEILTYISTLAKKEKFFELKDNKFCFLETVNVPVVKKDDVYFISGMFKSARNEFRPNLINKRTGNERKNPKEITEGDIEKTHFVIRIDKSVGEVFLFLESNFHGVTINNVIGYFSDFNIKYLHATSKTRNYSIRHTIIPRNNFLTELDNLDRIKVAEVYFDKKLLGSQALNFSNRYISVKKDLKLVISATARESIREVGIDLYNSLNRRESDISKVRIHGTDQQNNEIILDTSFMSKVEFFTVDVDEDTGELDSSQVMSGLKTLANNF